MSINMDNCNFCGEKKSINYPHYILREAIKPPHTPYRWKKIGISCEECYEKNKDKFEKDPWRK